MIEIDIQQFDNNYQALQNLDADLDDGSGDDHGCSQESSVFSSTSASAYDHSHLCDDDLVSLHVDNKAKVPLPTFSTVFQTPSVTISASQPHFTTHNGQIGGNVNDLPPISALHGGRQEEDHGDSETRGNPRVVAPNGGTTTSSLDVYSSQMICIFQSVLSYTILSSILIPSYVVRSSILLRDALVFL